jgi:hypothetical protein
MDDALLVRGLQRINDFARNSDRLIDRNRSPGQAIRERLAIDELENEKL